MIIINFGHPLTEPIVDRVCEITGETNPKVIFNPAGFDQEEPFGPQVRSLVNEVGLTSEEWQTEKIVINPPTLHIISVALLAELHGRMGYFPTVIRLRPIAESLPLAYEFAELINLQAIRDSSRNLR
jgi:hypothetical protein